jgi:hypothetical protein
MSNELLNDGAGNPEYSQQANAAWLSAASDANIDVSAFSSQGTLEERIRWASEQGLEIGTVVARSASASVHAAHNQMLRCVRAAAARRIYVPAEYIFVERGVSGTRFPSDGLDRAELVATGLSASSCFGTSRLCREIGKAVNFLRAK